MTHFLVLYPLNEREQLSKQIIRLYYSYYFMIDGDYGIFAQIAQPDGKCFIRDLNGKPIVRTRPLPDNVFLQLHDDGDIRKTRNNVWEKEMVYAYAKEFKKIKTSEKTSPKNRAILAYLRELDSDIPVILDWH